MQVYHHGYNSCVDASIFSLILRYQEFNLFIWYPIQHYSSIFTYTLHLSTNYFQNLLYLYLSPLFVSSPISPIQVIFFRKSLVKPSFYLVAVKESFTLVPHAFLLPTL
jgi:hypothetical protein